MAVKPAMLNLLHRHEFVHAPSKVQLAGIKIPLSCTFDKYAPPSLTSLCYRRLCFQHLDTRELQVRTDVVLLGR